jgi:hypothetical protein
MSRLTGQEPASGDEREQLGEQRQVVEISQV